MNELTILPLTEAKNKLTEVARRAETTHERFLATRNGKASVVILSADDYDALMETLDVLSDPEGVAELLRSKEDADAGRTWSLAEVMAERSAREGQQ
jgi:prevent-host-death family protein